MLRLFVSILFCCIFCSLYANDEQRKSNDNEYNAVEYRVLSPLDVGGGEGVSAPFAGIIGNHLVVAGGCNFPDLPAAEGGAKKFYSHIYSIENPLDTLSKWKIVGELPYEVAYGVGISVPEGLICIGGTDGRQSFGNVYLLSGSGDRVEIKELPSLPIPLDNMAGGFGGGYVYVAAGQSNGKPTKAAFRMKYPECLSWEQLPDFDGEVRLQACGVVQNGSTSQNFYLLGGYAPATDTSLCVVHDDAIVYDANGKRWFHTSKFVVDGERKSLVGANAIVSGSTNIVCVGGVDREVFEAAVNRPNLIKQAEKQKDTASLTVLLNDADSYMKHDPDWYEFQDELLIYNTITDEWVTESSSEKLSRAGAGLVAYNGHWIVVNGETKPGIRSSDVTAITMTTKTNFGWLNWTVLIVYLLGMLMLGFYFMRRGNNSDDFFRGGGRIPWWAAGISIYATMLSAITYMSYPAKAYATNWTYYPMLITILLMAFPVIKYYLPFFRKLNVTSAYEYLEIRFNVATRMMASALFIVFMIARMALVLYLPSLALTTVTGIDVYTCIILMGLITVVYCTMGGVEAVVWGDVVQGIILVGGALLAVVYLVFGTEGGPVAFVNIASENEKFKLFQWSLDYRSATFWVIIIGGLANNLISYTSDQTVIQRYMTTKDEKSARHSILMNGIMSVCISVVFFAIGTGLYTFYKTHPAEIDYTMAKVDTIFPFFMMSQLPAGVAGLLIAAIFAATMSTISSNINSVATAFSIDFYRRWQPNASDKNVVRVARYTCVVAGLIGLSIALLMATWNIFSLLDFFQEILGLLSSGLGGLFLMGVFFPRIGGKSAFIGFVSGVVAVFLVKYFTDVNVLLYGAIGIVTCVLVGYMLSFINNERTLAKSSR